MDDKRFFGRWDDTKERVVVSYADSKEEAQILDVSAGGMRVVLQKPIDVGCIVYGQFSVLDLPYYVRGRVARAAQKSDIWEAAITFDKVSTTPIAA